MTIAYVLLKDVKGQYQGYKMYLTGYMKQIYIWQAIWNLYILPHIRFDGISDGNSSSHFG
jgi:hypothetical protein